MLHRILVIPCLLITIQAHGGATHSKPSQESIALGWLFDTAARNSDYAARRMAAGKSNESMVISAFLSDYLSITPQETDLIVKVATQYEEHRKDLLAECIYNEIIWVREHPSSGFGLPTWRAPGFPIDFNRRSDALMHDAINKLRHGLGESRFQYLNSIVSKKLMPLYSGTVIKQP